MSEVFFTSDTHFGHRGILSFEATKPYRDFPTIEDHDAELINRWNHQVQVNDTVYHLGDFCFGKRNVQIAQFLNGKKILIMGNHDIYGAPEYLQYFHKVFGAHDYKGMILTHVPVHTNQLSRYFMNVHGHLHTVHVTKEGGSRDCRYFNACVENHNLTPIPLDEIFNFWAENKNA